VQPSVPNSPERAAGAQPVEARDVRDAINKMKPIAPKSSQQHGTNIDTNNPKQRHSDGGA